jgi:ubiquinol-cytochrome c reductase cytochrome b subunit
MLRPNAKGQISPAERFRSAISNWFFEDRITPVTATELEQQHHVGHGALEGGETTEIESGHH